VASEVFIDDKGEEDGRSRSEVLPDYRFHEILDNDLADIDIDQALSGRQLDEHLRDDRIYFVNKDFYHTGANVDLENVHKVDAGPQGEGRAGDLDVGFVDIPSGRLERIELKSSGTIPSAPD
jgi:hypothetical protein